MIWGYHHFRKHPYTFPRKEYEFERLPTSQRYYDHANVLLKTKALLKKLLTFPDPWCLVEQPFNEGKSQHCKIDWWSLHWSRSVRFHSTWFCQISTCSEGKTLQFSGFFPQVSKRCMSQRFIMAVSGIDSIAVFWHQKRPVNFATLWHESSMIQLDRAVLDL